MRSPRMNDVCKNHQFWWFFVVLMNLSLTVQAQTITGVVYPAKALTLSFGVSGLIQDQWVEEGQIVKFKQTLVGLDSQHQALEKKRRRIIWKDDSERHMLQAKYEIFQEKFKLTEEIFVQSKSVSRDELDQIQVELLNIQGRLNQLKAQKSRERLEYQQSEQELTQRLLMSPIDGVITRVYFQVGEWVKPGEPVMDMVDVSQVYLRLSVSDEQARLLKKEQALSITIEGIGARQGKVSYIAPNADAASGLVEVKVSIDNADGHIRPGVKASLDWPT